MKGLEKFLDLLMLDINNIEDLEFFENILIKSFEFGFIEVDDYNNYWNNVFDNCLERNLIDLINWIELK